MISNPYKLVQVIFALSTVYVTSCTSIPSLNVDDGLPVTENDFTLSPKQLKETFPIVNRGTTDDKAGPSRFELKSLVKLWGAADETHSVPTNSGIQRASLSTPLFLVAAADYAVAGVAILTLNYFLDLPKYEILSWQKGKYLVEVEAIGKPNEMGEAIISDWKWTYLDSEKEIELHPDNKSPYVFQFEFSRRIDDFGKGQPHSENDAIGTLELGFLVGRKFTVSGSTSLELLYGYKTGFPILKGNGDYFYEHISRHTIRALMTTQLSKKWYVTVGPSYNFNATLKRDYSDNVTLKDSVGIVAQLSYDFSRMRHSPHSLVSYEYLDYELPNGESYSADSLAAIATISRQN